MVSDPIILATIFLSTWQHANNDEPICRRSIGLLNGEAKVLASIAVPLRSDRISSDDSRKLSSADEAPQPRGDRGAGSPTPLMRPGSGTPLEGP